MGALHCVSYVKVAVKLLLYTRTGAVPELSRTPLSTSLWFLGLFSSSLPLFFFLTIPGLLHNADPRVLRVGCKWVRVQGRRILSTWVASAIGLQHCKGCLQTPNHAGDALLRYQGFADPGSEDGPPFRFTEDSSSKSQVSPVETTAQKPLWGNKTEDSPTTFYYVIIGIVSHAHLLGKWFMQHGFTLAWD